MPRGLLIDPGVSVQLVVECCTCAVMEPPRITRLPKDHEQIVIRVGDYAGELDLCEACMVSATIELLVEALRNTVGVRRARTQARGEYGNRPEDPFSGTRAPCPLCSQTFSTPSGVWGHLERAHQLKLTPQQKDQVWGRTCMFGCGFPTVSGRSMSQHLGRAHPTVKGGQLFAGLAQARAEGEDLAEEIVKRIIRFGKPLRAKREAS